MDQQGQQERKYPIPHWKRLPNPYGYKQPPHLYHQHPQNLPRPRPIHPQNHLAFLNQTSGHLPLPPSTELGKENVGGEAILQDLLKYNERNLPGRSLQFSPQANPKQIQPTAKKPRRSRKTLPQESLVIDDEKIRWDPRILSQDDVVDVINDFLPGALVQTHGYDEETSWDIVRDIIKEVFEPNPILQKITRIIAPLNTFKDS